MRKTGTKREVLTSMPDLITPSLCKQVFNSQTHRAAARVIIGDMSTFGEARQGSLTCNLVIG